MIPAVRAGENGKRRDANLRLLIHYAGVFSGGENGQLCDFIKYMENLSSGNVRLAQAKTAPGGGGAVKLMTIHGSKGLEFPICIVSNVTSSGSVRETADIVCSPLGIGMKLIDAQRMLVIDTMTYDAVSSENERLDLSEEMRLLYVAATRAKEKLIFTAPVKSGSKPGMHLGWLLSGEAVRNGLIGVRNIDSYEPGAVSESTAKTQAEKEPPRFSEYAYSPFTRIPAKVTATQIGVKSVDDLEVYGDSIDRYLRIPSFIRPDGKAKLSGKKRGDAYHKVMELLDFSCASGSARVQIDGMLTRGKLTQTERISIDDGEIDGFLNSELCRRAVNSGDINREYPIFCEYTPEKGEYGVNDWTNEEKPFIQGIADMFFIEDGEIVLVDYKTNTGVSASQLTEEYRGQLAVYAGALEEALGMRVKEKILYSFSLGEIRVE